MDQNQNNDLFNFDQPSQKPQPPEPTPDEPTIFSGGAQVYEVPPSQQPVEPPPPVFTPPPPSFTPPPPPYNPPPTATAQPPKSNRTIWIIVIVAVLLLCCCCLVVAGIWLYNNGDQFIEQFGALLPAVFQMLA